MEWSAVEIERLMTNPSFPVENHILYITPHEKMYFAIQKCIKIKLYAFWTSGFTSVYVCYIKYM